MITGIATSGCKISFTISTLKRNCRVPSCSLPVPVDSRTLFSNSANNFRSALPTERTATSGFDCKMSRWATDVNDSHPSIVSALGRIAHPGCIPLTMTMGIESPIAFFTSSAITGSLPRTNTLSGSRVGISSANEVLGAANSTISSGASTPANAIGVVTETVAVTISATPIAMVIPTPAQIG